MTPTHPSTTRSPRLVPTPFGVLARGLYDEKPSVRAAAAIALGAHPDETAASHRLACLLDDRDPTVRVAVTRSLATILTARPDLVAWVSTELRGEGRPAYFETVHRLIALLDTPKALDALFAARFAGEPEECAALLAGVADTGRFATGCLLALLERDDDAERRIVVGEILIGRGFEAGYRVLLGTVDARTRMDELIDRGPEGIRLLCRVGAGDEYGSMDLVAQRLARRRRSTEPTVRELAATGTSTEGAEVAVLTLGYWDEPQTAEALIAIARDPARERDLRVVALEALCRLEAPEAIETLGEAMMDESLEHETRWRCADALGEIGNAGGLPALERVARAYRRRKLGACARAAIRRIAE